MARHALNVAVLTAVLNLLYAAPVILAQNSTSGPTRAVSVGTMVNTGGAPQPSGSAGQSPQGHAPAPPQPARRRLDPEMAAIFQAEQEGRLVDAEKLLTAAIQKAESAPGSEKRLGILVNNLASLKMRQGRRDEAVAAAGRALAIDRGYYGPESPAIVRDLSNLAVMTLAARIPGTEAIAEEEYKQALAIARLNQNTQPGILLMVLNNLSQFYMRQKRPADAESLINEALDVCQNNARLDPVRCAPFRRLLAQTYRQEGHPNAAVDMSFEAAASDGTSNHSWSEKLMDLETLARQYEIDGSYDLAETTYRQALALVQANSKPNQHGILPPLMTELGEVLVKEGQYAAAEDFFKRALDLQEESARSQPSGFPLWLDFYPLLNLYRRQGRLEDIEPVIQQGIAIQEQHSDAGKEPLTESLLTLARVYEEENKYPDAEPLCERALKIQEADYGPESPHLISAIETYAGVLRHVGKTAEAQTLQARANAIQGNYFSK